MNMNFFSLLLVIATFTGVFAAPSNGSFQIITKSEANVNLNLRVSVSSGAIVLDSSSGASASATSRVTENGKLEVVPNVYAGVDSEGYLTHVSSSAAATGFAISDGKLTYKDNGNFYAVPHGGSQYRICIRETVTTSVKITVAANVPGGSSPAGNFPSSTPGPVTVTTYLRPSTTSKENTPTTASSTVTVTVIETPVGEEPSSKPSAGTVTVTYTESPLFTPTAVVSGGVTVTVTASLSAGGPHYRNSTAFLPRGIKTVLQ